MKMLLLATFSVLSMGASQGLANPPAANQPACNFNTAKSLDPHEAINFQVAGGGKTTKEVARDSDYDRSMRQLAVEMNAQAVTDCKGIDTTSKAVDQFSGDLLQACFKKCFARVNGKQANDCMSECTKARNQAWHGIEAYFLGRSDESATCTPRLPSAQKNVVPTSP